MPLPKTLDEFVKAGYRYAGTSFCRKCKEKILWYETPLHGKWLPLNPDATTHWATCPYAKEFKKEKR